MGTEWIQLAHKNFPFILLSVLLLLIPISDCSTIQKREIIIRNSTLPKNVTNPIAIESTIKTAINVSTITSSTANTTTVNPIAPTTIVAQSQSPVIELPELNTTTTTTTPRAQIVSNETTSTNASLANSKLHDELNRNNESTTLGAGGNDDTTIVPITTDLSHSNVDNDVANTTPFHQQQQDDNVDVEDEVDPFLTTQTVAVATEDNFDRFTIDYNETLNDTSIHNLITNNFIDETKFLQTTPSPFTINITDISDFDQIILTTPTTPFFDEKHKEYENEADFKTSPYNDHDDHDQFKIEQSKNEPKYVHVQMDVIKDNSTNEQRSWIYYNNAEVESKRYDTAANEVRNISEAANGTTTTTEKRGKYLQSLENDIGNLTIPGTANVWALASMKNVEHNKTREGTFHNVTLIKKQYPGSSKFNDNTNETIVSKQLADWVEVMKNDVFSNHTFGANNESSIDHIKNVEQNATNEIHDTASAENQIILSNEPVDLKTTLNPNRNSLNLSAVPDTENKLDPVKEEGNDYDNNDILSKNKIKKGNVIVANTTKYELGRTVSDVEKTGLAHREEPNTIKRDSQAMEQTTPKLALNTPATSTEERIVEKPIITTEGPTATTETEVTTLRESPPTTLLNHETTDMDAGTTKTVSEEIEPITITIEPDREIDLTTTDLSKIDGLTILTELSTTFEPPKTTPILTSVSLGGPRIEPSTQQYPYENPTEPINENKVNITSNVTTDHSKNPEISTNIIHLDQDEFKYSTVMPDVETAKSTVGVERKIPDADGEGNIKTTENTATTNAGGLSGLGEVASDDGTDTNVIIASVVSAVGLLCILLVIGFFVIMRKRRKQITYGQRCRPVGLDAYSLDNVSVYNSVRRKGILRASKRSYGNAAFDDPTLKNHLLSITELMTFVSQKTAIYDEFKELPTVTARADEVPPGCELKNRYANVVPLPETRVMLKCINDDDLSEYINANYVKPPKDPATYYIACQAPLENTIIDFWRMMWEQNSRVIIMLTDLSENGIEKCAEYLPPSVVLDNHITFGDFTVTLKSREVKDKYAVSTIHLKNIVTKTWREITHFWYKWPDSGVPSDEASVIAMLLEARGFVKFVPADQIDDSDHVDGNGTVGGSSYHGNGNIDKTKSLQKVQGPLTVHCSPGTGRTGTVIACDIALRALEQPTRSVDIPQIVYCVRRGRASAVQTREQYEFIYKVAHLHATKLTGPIAEN